MTDSTKCLLYDDDGDTTELPTVWDVCHNCGGDGSHSKHLGAITQEDRDRDWDDESFMHYLSGGYDMECEVCKGRRVVAVVDRSRLDAETLAAWDEQCVADADYEALCAMERRMGA